MTAQPFPAGKAPWRSNPRGRSIRHGPELRVIRCSATRARAIREAGRLSQATYTHFVETTPASRVNSPDLGRSRSRRRTKYAQPAHQAHSLPSAEGETRLSRSFGPNSGPNRQAHAPAVPPPQQCGSGNAVVALISDRATNEFISRMLLRRESFSKKNFS